MTEPSLILWDGRIQTIQEFRLLDMSPFYSRGLNLADIRLGDMADFAFLLMHYTVYLAQLFIPGRYVTDMLTWNEISSLQSYLEIKLTCQRQMIHVYLCGD